MEAPHAHRLVVEIAADRVLLETPAIFEEQDVRALDFRMIVKRREIAKEIRWIDQLTDELSDQIVVLIIVLQRFSGDAPHVGESLIPGEDAAVGADDQDSVGR